jgi:hypothetical protein
MARVFIPQVVTRFNPVSKTKEPVFDFSAAAQHGTLINVLSEEDNPLFLAHLAPKIRKALDDFKEEDRLLAVGDPSVIAICSGIILRRQRVLNMLKWDRKLQVYINVEVRP